jgi:HAD superfamily hydrolase (TIGR01459 family)
MRNNHTNPVAIKGLREAILAYDGAIVDLWGVVHNGVTAFPDAVDALRKMRSHGVKTCLLSNAPRRCDTVIKSLTEMGISRDLYDHIVTSGEAAIAALQRPAFSQMLGRRYFHIGPDFLKELAHGTDLVEMSELKDCDFILCTGTDRDETLDRVMPLLKTAADLELPMVCVNPDLLVYIGDRQVLCAGSVAKQYETMGGIVHYFGKPHAEVYWQAFDALKLERRKVVAIGDAIRTDIVGAANQKLDSIFVASGLHRDEINCNADGQPDISTIASLAARDNVTPTFVTAALAW